MASDFFEMVRFRKDKSIPNIFDVDLLNLDRLKKFDSVECHVVTYPFSRKITKNEYSFNPFEEYVRDISENHKSAYERLHGHGKEFFGIFLGFVILLAFLKFRPDILISVESVVGIFGAYFIGKDLWDDLEGFFINISKDWRIKYQENYYGYALDKNSTMTQYTRYARKKRYGKEMVLADKMDFIEHHNSSTARMYFDTKSFVADDAAHLLSIAVNQDKLFEFEKGGFLFGVKMSLNRKFLFFEFGTDFFQSLEHGRHGCLDAKGKWIDEYLFFRKIFRIGRFKWSYRNGYLKKRLIT